MDSSCVYPAEPRKPLKNGTEFIHRSLCAISHLRLRRGPNGPATLCNPCGLQWMKSTRRIDELYGEKERGKAHVG